MLGEDMRIFTLLGIVLALGVPTAVAAQVSFTVPDVSLRATAYIICGNKQGSGVLTNAEPGYVLTAGHVAMDSTTRQPASSCTVSFTGENGEPKNSFAATVVRAVFDERVDRDFAVLKLGARLGGSPALPQPLRVNEYAWPGDAISALGFPGSDGMLRVVTGAIEGFSRGSIRTDAKIAEGYSGGPAVDASGNLIGLAERINFLIEADGTKVPVRYEMGDIQNLLHWLDGANASGHDEFVLHVDAARYHAEPYHIREEALGCAYVVRTAESSTVYCLMDGAVRLVFPNQAIFESWNVADSDVLRISGEDLTKYRLIGNVTMKPGSLVKITTDPKTYLVTDTVGTLRHIPSETRASVLFGMDWATRVRDVPDTFFIDYSVGAPLAP